MRRLLTAALAISVVVGLAIGLPLASAAFAASETGGFGAVAAATGSATPTASASAGSSVSVTIPGSTSTGGTGTGTGTGTGGGTTGGGGATGGGGTTGPQQPPIPSNPVPASGVLVITPKVLQEGDYLTAVGHGFTPGEKVQFILYPGPILEGNAIASKTGVATFVFKLPKTTRAGQYELEAEGWTSSKIESGTFTVIQGIGGASSIFPWIWWLVAGLAVLITLIGILVASLLGWLPWAGPRAVPVGGK